MNRQVVVAAVDGRPPGWDALEWASADAASRGAALRIVHAVPVGMAAFDPFGATWEEMTAAGGDIVDEAVRRARQVAPEIEIDAHLCSGWPAASILRLARGAALIVLGRPVRPGRRRTGTLGRVVARAHAPVVAVELTRSPIAAAATGRVVLHLDRQADEAPLEFALGAALRTGLGLTVVSAGPAGPGLARWRAAFPDLDVYECGASDGGAAPDRGTRGAALQVITRPRRPSAAARLVGGLTGTIAVIGATAVAESDPAPPKWTVRSILG